jgi:hypothetical protein
MLRKKGKDERINKDKKKQIRSDEGKMRRKKR